VSEIAALVQQLPPLEAAGVLFGLAYLVLAIRENLWCWPAAFISSVLTVVVMMGAKLYAEAALNVFYAGMAVYGFMQWRYGGRRHGRNELPIGTWPMRTHVLAIVASLVASAAVGWWLSNRTDAAFPYADALVTVGSVVTTYMVARKVLENWLYWLVIDALAATLYFARELYLYFGLFVLYLVLVVIGWLRWHRDWRSQRGVAA
jgi:nicotinamide mononucleotide transporter